MAFLHDSIQFTGSINGLSAYKMRGSDKIILRTPGGASKRQIQKSPAFEATRKLNNEWKGVTQAATKIRHGLWELKLLADYNISGPLNALAKRIQSMDTGNPKGRRSILFSLQPDALSCFHYNRQTLFDSVIRQPLDVNIDKSTAVVDVTLPFLQPQINFFPNPRYAYFRIQMACTSVSNYTCAEGHSDYLPLSSKMPEYLSVNSEWSTTKFPQPSLHFKVVPRFDFQTGPEMVILFGAGIQYGMPGADGSIQPVPHAGAARIIKCV
jgi:hypothetical protein